MSKKQNKCVMLSDIQVQSHRIIIFINDNSQDSVRRFIYADLGMICKNVTVKC